MLVLLYYLLRLSHVLSRVRPSDFRWAAAKLPLGKHEPALLVLMQPLLNQPALDGLDL